MFFIWENRRQTERRLQNVKIEKIYVYISLTEQKKKKEERKRMLQPIQANKLQLLRSLKLR